MIRQFTCVAFWSFSYGLEFKSAGLEAKRFWVRVEYLGVAWVGVLYFQFTMTLIGKGAWLKGSRGKTILILPALTILAVFTNPYHQLIWSRVWIDHSGPVTALVYQRGIGFWIFVAYFIITENHAGRLSVDSSPGWGTVFTIRLPLTHKPPSRETDQ